MSLSFSSLTEQEYNTGKHFDEVYYLHLYCEMHRNNDKTEIHIKKQINYLFLKCPFTSNNL